MPISAIVGQDEMKRALLIAAVDPKINCATCHQGVNKPMNGVSMRADKP